MSQFDLFSEPAQLTDQEARDVIVRALNRNIVVKAGAGAGKTHELLGRMVACVRRGACDVDQMAAITFTRKAAGELKQRFAAQLSAEHDRLVKSNDPALRAEASRLGDALQHVDDCFIGTIHAFCARLLRERPVEAGLPPDFIELDERDDVAVREEAWDEFIESLYERDGPLLAGLTEVGIRPHDLTEFLRIRYDFADLPLKATVASEPDLSDAVNAAARLIQDSLPHLSDRWEEEDKYSRMARKAVLTITRDGVDTTLRQAEFLRRVDAGTRGSSFLVLKRWKDKGIAKQYRDERIPAMRQVLEPALRGWREYAYTRVAPVADAAVKFYEGYRRRNGLVTFYDLLERSVVLLRDHPEVRAHFQGRYQRMFVDEFQDTDPMQAEMLLLLASTDVRQKRWVDVVPRPGSLFVVGDEKQSIYRFRRADIETFRAVATLIERHGGRVVNLTTSFRSSEQLCQRLNAVLQRVLDDGSSAEFQAPFAPLTPAPSAASTTSFGLPIQLLDTGDLDRGKDVAEGEATRLARYIADAVGRGAALPSDFLIIARERANLGAFARALEELRIPYDISGGDQLGKSEELSLLIDVLSVVERPGNPVAFFKYLRGPLIGLSDRDFYDFKQRGGSFYYREACAMVEGASDKAMSASLINACEQLRFVERVLTTRPPYAAFKQVLDVFGLLPHAATLGGGTLRAGSLLRILSYVRQWSSEGKSWVSILSELRKLVRDTVGTIETMTLEVGRSDVVRIMTVHQAKGLESRIVVLADAGRNSRQNWVEPHVSRVGGAPMLSMAVQAKGQTLAQPEGWAEDSARELLFRAAEEDRVRYVGATRAEELLIVCQHKSKGFWKDISIRLPDETPEIRIPEEQTPQPLTAPTADVEKLAEDRESSIRSGSAPVLHLMTVTAGRDDAFVPVTQPGRGPRYGSAVHQIMESLVHRPDDVLSEEHVAAVLERHLERQATVDEIQSITDGVARFKGSAVWERLGVSEFRYTEVPVVVREANAVRSGSIDLIFKHGSEWELIDYKTDAVTSEGDVAKLRDHYGSQLAQYARDWNAATGLPVHRVGIWLFGVAQLVSIDLAAPSALDRTTTYR